MDDKAVGCRSHLRRQKSMLKSVARQGSCCQARISWLSEFSRLREETNSKKSVDCLKIFLETLVEERTCEVRILALFSISGGRRPNASL